MLLFKRYFRYIAFEYLKNFLILLAGLSFSIILIDFFQHAAKIGGGFNQKILYIFYNWEYIVTLIYPLVILFSLGWTIMSFISKNIFVSLYSFGYSKKQVYYPFILIAILIYITFTLLNCTSFAYGQDRARAILKHQNQSQVLNNIFFKHNDSFVHIKKLDAPQKKIYDVEIFVIKNSNVSAIISAKEAFFQDPYWIAKEVKLKKRIFKNNEVVGFEIKRGKNIKMLKGYVPEVVKKIYEGKSLTIIDGFYAYRLLLKQGLDTSKVKAVLFNKVVMPLFALVMLGVIFFKVPPYQRFIRKDKLWTAILGSSLLFWAFLFAMNRLAVNGVIDPVYGQLLPIVLLAIYFFYIYFKEP
jgi:lipopolysaccharide export system permease protein